MISPLSGVIDRMSIFEVVVLPQPDSPTRPRHSPALTVKLMSSTASTPAAGLLPGKTDLRVPKLFVRLRTMSKGSSADCAGGRGLVDIR